MKSSIFWDIMLCSKQARNQREAGSKQSSASVCFALVSCMAYSSTLKMEAKCSSETSVDFQRTVLSTLNKQSRKLDREKDEQE
jgi:hypothetical protein